MMVAMSKPMALNALLLAQVQDAALLYSTAKFLLPFPYQCFRAWWHLMQQAAAFSIA